MYKNNIKSFLDMKTQKNLLPIHPSLSSNWWMFSTIETNSRKRKIGNRKFNTEKRQWELQKDGEEQSQDEGWLVQIGVSADSHTGDSHNHDPHCHFNLSIAQNASVSLYLACLNYRLELIYSPSCPAAWISEDLHFIENARNVCFSLFLKVGENPWGV